MREFHYIRYDFSEGVQKVHDAMAVPKAMALRAGMDHGKMLYSADGYVTAWLLWYLQGDETAAKVFSDTDPEFLNNPLYVNQASSSAR